jgi:hypothetical protein
MLPHMTERSATARRRVWWAVILVTACTRMFAGAPELEAHQHVGDAPMHPHAVLVEHDHSLTDQRDTLNSGHFHCHSGCADAPVAIPSVPSILSTAATSHLLPFLGKTLAVHRAFLHFRPPRA